MNSFFFIVGIFALLFLLSFAVIFYRRWSEDRSLPEILSAEEFIAAIYSSQYKDDDIKRMSPHVVRKNIDDVRRINEAIMNHRPYLFGFMQSEDNNPIY